MTENVRTEPQTGGGGDDASGGDWGHHPINIRSSIRTLLSRYYVTVLAGPERRSKSRRQEERGQHPIVARNNLMLFASLLAVFAGICASIGLWIGVFIAYALLGP
jgi:hypothetical protein